MKKTIYIICALLITMYSCETDFDAADQGIELQDLPNYVAFSVDGAGVTLAPIEVSEADGDTGDEINVEIPGGTLSDVTVNYEFGGTAIFGTDFTVDGATSSGGSIVIDYNNTPNVDGLPFNADIVVNILTDNVGDGEKTLTITLTSAANAEGNIAVGRGGKDILKTATIIISDADYVAVASEELSVAENAGTATIELEAFPGSARANDINVEYTLGGSAVFGVDYTITGATMSGGTLVIPAPATTPEDGDPVKFELEIEILTDSAADGDKTIEFTLTSANDGEDLSVGVGGSNAGRSSTITIVDVANSVAFSNKPEPIEVTETDGSTNLTLELHAGDTALTDVTVNYSFSGNAVFGTDFTIAGATATGGSIVITPNATPGGAPTTLDLPIQILTDAISDGEKTLTVTIDSATLSDMTELSVGVGGSSNKCTISISDVDFVAFNETSTEIDVDENGGSTNATLEALTNVNINVNYSLGGTAVYGVDYTITGATSQGGTATIVPNGGPGVNSSLDLDVQILTDATADGKKTITITIDTASQANGTEYAIGSNNTSTITIADVD